MKKNKYGMIALHGGKLWYDPKTGETVPVIAGGSEEFGGILGSIAIAWDNTTKAPTAGGDAAGLARIQVPSKTLLKNITLTLAGVYDQSVGNETLATEGCPVLIQDVRLVLDGRTRRSFPGPVLYELNRIINGGAGPKTDPAVGVAAGKAFTCSLDLDMGFLDADGPIAAENPVEYRRTTYLDLSQYSNVWLEVQIAAFNAYASGNTQATMSATLTANTVEILRAPALKPQSHFEAQLVNVVDMNITANERRIPLNREGLIIRGVLLRVGTLSATPRGTAITSLLRVGVDGKLKAGGKTQLKEKQPVAVYQAQVGQRRNGISLLAGYLFIDLANNRRRSSHLVGKSYDQLDLLFDSSAVANSTMQVYELVKSF